MGDTEVCTGFKGNFNDRVDKLVHMAVGLPHTCYKLAKSLLRSNKLGNHSHFWPWWLAILMDALGTFLRMWMNTSTPSPQGFGKYRRRLSCSTVWVSKSNLHMELYRILSTEVMTRGKFLPEINYLLNQIGNCGIFGSPYWGEWMDLIVLKFQKQRRHFDSVIFEKWSNLHCNFEVADV